jgi:DnaJ family protein C protein 9
LWLQAEYRGGQEERRDVLTHYQEFNGRMPRVFEWVMLSDTERDSHRYMDWIDAAIEAGESVWGASPGLACLA